MRARLLEALLLPRLDIDRLLGVAIVAASGPELSGSTRRDFGIGELFLPSLGSLTVLGGPVILRVVEGPDAMVAISDGWGTASALSAGSMSSSGISSTGGGDICFLFLLALLFASPLSAVRWAITVVSTANRGFRNDRSTHSYLALEQGTGQNCLVRTWPRLSQEETRRRPVYRAISFGHHWNNEEKHGGPYSSNQRRMPLMAGAFAC
jgi:hypothetical protein